MNFLSRVCKWNMGNKLNRKGYWEIDNSTQVWQSTLHYNFLKQQLVVGTFGKSTEGWMFWVFYSYWSFTYMSASILWLIVHFQIIFLSIMPFILWFPYKWPWLFPSMTIWEKVSILQINTCVSQKCNFFLISLLHTSLVYHYQSFNRAFSTTSCHNCV